MKKSTIKLLTAILLAIAGVGTLYYLSGRAEAPSSYFYTFDKNTNNVSFKVNFLGQNYTLANIWLIKNECTSPVPPDNCFADIGFSSPYLSNFNGFSIYGVTLPSVVSNNLNFNVTRGNITSYRMVSWHNNTVSRNITEYISYSWNETITDLNGTYNVTRYGQNISGSHIENSSYLSEVPLFSNLNDAMSIKKFRIYGSVDRDSSVDWIGNFFGMNVTELAWWNTSYPTKYPIYVNGNYVSGIPYLLPGVSGVMWINATNNSWLYNSTTIPPGYAVVDSTETTQQNMTNESANVASYGNVFLGISGLVEGWGLNGNANGWKGAINGTAHATYISSGKFAGAYTFNGSTAYINVGNSASLYQANNFTITAWIYTYGKAQTQEIITRQMGTTPWTGYSIALGQVVPDSNKLDFWDGTTWLTSNYVIPNNSWQYIALTLNSSNYALFFVNGSLVSTVASSAIGAGSFNFLIGTNAGVGADGQGVPYFNGSIDEVRFWNRPLTQAELTADYNAANISTLGSAQILTPPTVTLSSPTDNLWTNSKTVQFKFTPVLNQGASSFLNASIWTNATGTFAQTQANTTSVTNNSINSISYTFASDNSYLWGVQVCDNNNLCNMSTTNRTIKIDSIAPSAITYVTPTDQSANVSRNWYYVNVTFTEINPDTCLMNETGTSNIAMTRSGTNCYKNMSGKTDGIYTYNVTVNDSAGNIGTSTSKAVTIDLTNPSVTITSPASDGLNYSTAPSITASCTDANFVNMTGSSAYVATKTSTPSTWTNTSTLNQGSNSVTITCTDASGRTSNAVRSFNFDTVAPTISGAGLNKSSVNDSTESILINFSVSDISSGVSKCWAQLTLKNGSASNLTAISPSGGVCQLTSAISQVGDFSMIPFANDTAGNTGNGSTLSGVRISASLGGLYLYNTTYIKVGNVDYLAKNITANNTLGSLNATNASITNNALGGVWTCTERLTTVDAQNGSVNTTRALLCGGTPVSEIASIACPSGHTNYSGYCFKSTTDTSYVTYDHYSKMNVIDNNTWGMQIRYYIPLSRLTDFGVASSITAYVGNSATNISLSSDATNEIIVIDANLSAGTSEVNLTYRVPRAHVSSTPSLGPPINPPSTIDYSTITFSPDTLTYSLIPDRKYYENITILNPNGAEIPVKISTCNTDQSCIWISFNRNGYYYSTLDVTLPAGTKSNPSRTVIESLAQIPWTYNSTQVYSANISLSYGGLQKQIPVSLILYEQNQGLSWLQQWMNADVVPFKRPIPMPITGGEITGLKIGYVVAASALFILGIGYLAWPKKRKEA